MADKEHLKILKQGVTDWNQWREANPAIIPDLSEAHLFMSNLSGANLATVDLSGADLSMSDLFMSNLCWANLSRANLLWSHLIEANLSDAQLSEANLSGANLREAHFRGADLSDVNLSAAELFMTNFSWAVLSGANLSKAHLRGTVLGGVNLSRVKGLDECEHYGPSILDHRTLQQSGPLPLKFLRGCGLPDILIDYLPSLLNQPIQYYSCFMSYSAKNQEFVDRLYADLQNAGVRCWLASEDLKIGDKMRPAIDDAIRLRDKLLIVLSEQSISSAWVEKEVETAFEEERRRNTTVLFPVRIDDAVMQTEQAWAADIRRTRHIGDFRNWKDHDAYKKGFDRLLRDLKQPTKIDKS